MKRLRTKMHPVMVKVRTASLAGCVVGAAVSLRVHAADEETIGFSEIAAVHSEVIVPVPSEIFNVLDKFKVRKSEWHGELQVPKERDCSGRTHTALFLGSVVAEGFLAVQAEDGKAVSEIGQAVLDLADELGLRDEVLKHSKSIILIGQDWFTSTPTISRIISIASIHFGCRFTYSNDAIEESTMPSHLDSEHFPKN